MTIGVICGSVPNIPAIFRQQGNPFARFAKFVRGLPSNHGARSKEVLPLNEYKNPEARAGCPQKMRVGSHVLGPMHGYVCALLENFSASYPAVPQNPSTC